MKKIALALIVLAAACDGPADADGGTDGGPQQPDAQVERTPPTVALTIPGDGDVEVSPTASIRVVFSEPIDPASGTIALEADGAVDLGAPSASADRRELTVTPSAPLAGNTSYALTIQGFRDDAGDAMAAPHVVSFTTSDPFAPAVTSATPAEGASDVSTGLAAIELVFSEPMNASLGLAELSGGPGTLGAPTWDGARASFPVSGLAADTSYRVTLTGFADPAGNALDGEAYLGDGALDFTTGGDTTAPVVTESSPAEGATSVPPTRTTRVRVVFSEPMDTGAGAAELDLGGATTPLEASWAAGGTILLLDVSGLLVEGNAYRVTLTGFADVAGNALDGSVYLGDGALDFTTGDDELAPFVLFTNPAEGATGVRWTTSSLFVTFSEPMDTTRTRVPFDDGEITSFFDATWSSGGALLEIDVAGQLLSGRTYVLDFTAFTDAEATPLDVAHPYLGDGRLSFTMAAPEGENCQDYLRESEATVAGGVYTWTIGASQVTNVDGASPCDASGGSADAVVRYVKSTPDSTAATGGRVLRVTVTSSSTLTDRDINIDVLRNACDPATSVTGARLACRTGENPHSVDLDVGPGEYFVWVAASATTFRGATITIEEIPAGLGDTCRNAIPITAGTTALTPSGAQTIDAPSCAGSAITWYRYTPTQGAAFIEVAGTSIVGVLEAATGREATCGVTGTGPIGVPTPTASDVCVAVSSGATSITVNEVPYSGVRGVATPLSITRPLEADGDEMSITGDQWMRVDATRIYMGLSNGIVVAPKAGSARASFVPIATTQIGKGATFVGSALFSLDDGRPTAPTGRVFQMLSDGAGGFTSTPWDTGSTYANIEADAIAWDGTQLIVATYSPQISSSPAPTYFYAVSATSAGPATLLGTNDSLQQVGGMAADATYLYVAGEVAAVEGIYRLRRSDLSDPAALPELLWQGEMPERNATVILDDVTSPQVLYFRNYVVGSGVVTDIRPIYEPDSATPRVMAPLASIGRTADYGLAYDPAGPSIYLFETTSTFDGNFVRID